MRLTDIGANLTHSSFKHDLDDVLARARENGVERLVVTGADEPGSHAALALAKAHKGVLFATAGVHPHHAKDFNAEVEGALRELQTDALVVAVGETGLDYFRDLSPRAAQLFAFEHQLELGVQNGKPMFLHQRDAHGDFLACLDNVRDRISRAVVHCFTGERKELFDYLDRDFYIGITGWICDERRGLHLRELVKNIPANRLLLETDAPYLLPRDIKPSPAHRRNEPMYLAHICAEVARHRAEDASMTAANSTAAAAAFFALPAL
jgi:TatD DNase family protein